MYYIQCGVGYSPVRFWDPRVANNCGNATSPDETEMR